MTLLTLSWCWKLHILKILSIINSLNCIKPQLRKPSSILVIILSPKLLLNSTFLVFNTLISSIRAPHPTISTLSPSNPRNPHHTKNLHSLSVPNQALIHKFQQVSAKTLLCSIRTPLPFLYLTPKNSHHSQKVKKTRTLYQNQALIHEFQVIWDSNKFQLSLMDKEHKFYYTKRRKKLLLLTSTKLRAWHVFRGRHWMSLEQSNCYYLASLISGAFRGQSLSQKIKRA